MRDLLSTDEGREKDKDGVETEGGVNKGRGRKGETRVWR